MWVTASSYGDAAVEFAVRSPDLPRSEPVTGESGTRANEGETGTPKTKCNFAPLRRSPLRFQSACIFHELSDHVITAVTELKTNFGHQAIG